jgi:hypothetical protein
MKGKILLHRISIFKMPIQNLKEDHRNLVDMTQMPCLQDCWIIKMTLCNKWCLKISITWPPLKTFRMKIKIPFLDSNNIRISSNLKLPISLIKWKISNLSQWEWVFHMIHHLCNNFQSDREYTKKIFLKSLNRSIYIILRD